MSTLVPQVLIQDDGELSALRVLLDAMGVSYGDACDFPVAEEMQTDLLVSTPKRALSRGRDPGIESHCVSHIVLADAITNRLRSQLQRFQYSYIVEEPVHPAALRLLILDAVYRGPERRRLDRIAITEEIKIKSGWRSRTATLIQLSSRGCRILTDKTLAMDSDIEVALPKNLTTQGSQSFKGKVVGIDEHEEGALAIAIVFRRLERSEINLLKAIMSENAVGAGMQTPQKRPSAETRAGAPGDALETRTSGPEQTATPRSSTRARYLERVLASGAGRAQALMGRDLSTGGMRVAPDETLEPGASLKLVLYGVEGSEPVFVRATVLRDDGDGGVALRFDDLGPKTQASLEKLIASLPVLEVSEDDAKGRSVVVSQVIP